MANDAGWSKRTLMDVARGQRRVITLLLVGFPLLGFVGVLFRSAAKPDQQSLPLLLIVVLGVVQLVVIARLAFAIAPGLAWLFCLLSQVPVVNLFSLLYLNQRATKILKANGIGVEFLGARMSDFAKLKFKPDECAACGKSADEAVLECPRCRVRLCESCAERTRRSGGMVESFTMSCPHCKTELKELRTRVNAVEEPSPEDFGDDDDE